MRAVFGTDTRCQRLNERERAEQMIREAEAKVERLHNVLDHRPADDIDEAIHQITRERE